MLDPQQLLEIAREQTDPPGAGAPRQVVLRRAVSTAYYATFHALSRAATTNFVPANAGKSRVLFYRSLDHGRVRERCKKLGLNPLPTPERSFFSMQSFEQRLRDFANGFVSLQESRHRCDYDPEFGITKGQAKQAISDAAQMISDLNDAAQDERNKFLAYILFGLRPQ